MEHAVSRKFSTLLADSQLSTHDRRSGTHKSKLVEA